MSNQHNITLHECERCHNAHKLPFHQPTALYWCPTCFAMTSHKRIATLDNSESIDARILRLRDTLAQMPGSTVRVAKEEPVSAEVIYTKLKSRGYPPRAVENLGAMRGKALTLADSLFTKRQDAHWILYGGNGTGKTSMAVRAAANRVSAGKTSGRYQVVPELQQEMRAAIDRKQPQDEIIRVLKTCSLLVLDEAQDIGTDANDWAGSTLRSIADSRYRTFRPMIWLLNSDNEKAVIQKLGARIVDRAYETGGVIHCNWASYRSKNA